MSPSHALPYSPHPDQISLLSDRDLRLRPRAPRMRTIRMPRKLHTLAILQHQHLLQLAPNLLQNALALLRASPLPARNVPFPTAIHALAHRLRPQPDAVEAAADVDHHAHHFAVAVALERLPDSGEHDVQPEVVDRGGFAFEAVGPFAAVFVLGVFPFGADAFLEEVVVGFEAEFGDGGDVVLGGEQILAVVLEGGWRGAYVDAPELFHGVEGDDFLEQVVPVVALHQHQQRCS